MSSTGAPQGFFKGQMDEARIWNVARSQAAISDTMGGALFAPQANLIGRWGLDDGAGTTAANSAGVPNGTLASTCAAWPSQYGSRAARAIVTGTRARQRRAAPVGHDRRRRPRHLRRGDARRSGRRASRSRPGSSAKPRARQSAPARAASTADASRWSPRAAARPRASNVDFNYFLGINTAGATP